MLDGHQLFAHHPIQKEEELKEPLNKN